MRNRKKDYATPVAFVCFVAYFGIVVIIGLVTLIGHYKMEPQERNSPQFPVEEVPLIEIGPDYGIIVDIQLFDGKYLMIESIHEADEGEWENNQRFFDLERTRVEFNKPTLHDMYGDGVIHRR